MAKKSKSTTPSVKPENTLSASNFTKALLAQQSAAEQKKNQRFYEESKVDKCLGIRMGTIFAEAKKFSKMPLNEVEKLFASPYYEIRMGAVSIMDYQAREKKITPETREALYKLYIKKHKRINNWDFVDRSAPHVVGGYLADKSRAPLYKLAKSKDVWERRTAIVATWYFIRQNDINDTFKIAELLVHDKHDMIHKAVGSWVREAGKRDRQMLTNFLDQYAAGMPRIMLRYAIEKLDKKQRDFYMGRTTA
jgi:3-methyladenine DNA glycosylase AlkD